MPGTQIMMKIGKTVPPYSAHCNSEPLLYTIFDNLHVFPSCCLEETVDLGI